MDAKWGVRERSTKGNSRPLCRDGSINPQCGLSPSTLGPNTCFGDLAPSRCQARWVPTQAGSGALVDLSGDQQKLHPHAAGLRRALHIAWAGVR